MFYLICIFLSIQQSFSLINSDRVRQLTPRNPSRGPFKLICRKNEFVSAVLSTYSEMRPDRRRYKIHCTQMPIKGTFGVQCYESRLTPRGSSFGQSCPDDYYMIGFSASKLFARDREFRIHCCTSDRIRMRLCKNGTISERYLRFTKNFRNKNRVFTAMYSWYGRTYGDRKFMFTNCEMTPRTGKFTNLPKGLPNFRPSQKYQTPRTYPPRRYVIPAVTTTPPPEPEPIEPVDPNNAGENNNDEDIKIVIIPKKDDYDDENQSSSSTGGENISFLPGETRPFESFDLKCPLGHGIRSIFVRKIAKSLRYDATFAIKCDYLPSFVDPRQEESQLFSFLTFKDGSVQSSCNFMNNQYLCGIKGSYDDVRGMEAYCCRISSASVKLVGSAFAQSPTLEGSHLKADDQPNRFIGNIDQIADGSFVSQVIAFEPM